MVYAVGCLLKKGSPLHELAGINIVNAANPFLRLLFCPRFA